MKNILKVLFFSLIIIIVLFCAWVFIKPNYFSINTLYVVLGLLMSSFTYVNYKYKKEFKPKFNTDIPAFLFLILMIIFAIYVAIRYFNR